MKLLADENFSGPIIRGLREKNPYLDLIRVQEVGLMNTDDSIILAWAAQEGRILLTQDAKTMPDFAYDRVRQHLPMPGVVEVPKSLSIGQAIEEILILVECGEENQLRNRVVWLPL